MTLEQLFIRVGSQYTGGSDMKRALKDTDRLKEGTERLNKALNALTVVGLSAATAGLAAFTGWDRALTELAGKAGLTRKEFSGLYRDASRAIANATGAERLLVLEGIQRAHSLGGTPEENKKLVELAGVLHSTGQAQMTDAVEAAQALANQKLGSAPDLLQKIYRASQIGAGNVADYFLAAKAVAGTASIAGVGVDEMLSAISVVSSSAKSLSIGEAQVNSFLKAMAGGKDSATAKSWTEITGQDWSVLENMIREDGGLAKVVRHISENVDQSQLSQIFSRIEATKFIAAAMANIDSLESNRVVVKGAVEFDPIGQQQDQAYLAFSNSLDRLRETIKSFFLRFGEPIAKVLKPVLDILTYLLNGITILDRNIGGLITKTGALITAILALRWAIIGARAGIIALKGVKDLIGKRSDDSKMDLGMIRSAITGAVAGSVVSSGGLKAWVLRLSRWIIPTALIAIMATPVGRVLGILAGLAGVLMFSFKDSERVRKIRSIQDDARARHFENGGTEEDAPPPGKSDLLDMRLEKHRVAAESTWIEVGKMFDEFFGSFRASMPDWLGRIWDGFVDMMKSILSIPETIATWLWAIFKDPMNTLSDLWKTIKIEKEAQISEISVICF